MPRKLTATTTLENLKKEAKRWLKALRENDPEARQRWERAYPNSTPQPILRRVQHALAIEYGMESWIALVAALNPPAASAEAPQPSPAAVDLTLDFHCENLRAVRSWGASCPRQGSLLPPTFAAPMYGPFIRPGS